MVHTITMNIAAMKAPLIIASRGTRRGSSVFFVRSRLLIRRGGAPPRAVVLIAIMFKNIESMTNCNMKLDNRGLVFVKENGKSVNSVKVCIKLQVLTIIENVKNLKKSYLFNAIYSGNG